MDTAPSLPILYFSYSFSRTVSSVTSIRVFLGSNLDGHVLTGCHYRNTGCGLDNRDSIPCRWNYEFPHFATASRPVLGSTQPIIQWVLGAVIPRVKRLGREADHSHPSSSEVKNAWGLPPLPNTPSWPVASLKHRDNFVFCLLLCLVKHRANFTLPFHLTYWWIACDLP